MPTDRSRCRLDIEKGDWQMVICGIDAHKRTHTVVVIDERGRELATKTTKTTTTAAHLELVRWAERFGPEREWAVEDCRHLSRRLEADLLAAGERIRRVPPKLMAKARDSARTYGKSDPIDALAVARAALPNRHRLSRTGNRRLNAALHRIAITQLAHNPDARAFRDRRVAGGDTGTEALRALKRRLSDVVFRALLADVTPAQPDRLAHAA